MSIKENIEAINQKKAEAAAKIGKSGEEIMLVGVSKTKTPEEMNQGIDAGLADIGENKVQEIMDKFGFVKPVRWHMIGHLQTNKVKYIIDKVDMIHSVDSYKLAKEIDKRAAKHQRMMDILIQVNVAQEESKFGVASEETMSTGVLINGMISILSSVKMIPAKILIIKGFVIMLLMIVTVKFPVLFFLSP